MLKKPVVVTVSGPDGDALKKQHGMVLEAVMWLRRPTTVKCEVASEKSGPALLTVCVDGNVVSRGGFIPGDSLRQMIA